MSDTAVPSSFRDPSGFLFMREGVLLRQVNRGYGPHFERLLSSGLYDELKTDRLLVGHEQVDLAPADPECALLVLRPERLPFISHPYEWCFGQLKDAALLTLEIQARALARGMVLKDASAYNVQFQGARPLFIDTCSFETYAEGSPWVAYRQFCQHFLAPLALMSHCHLGLGQLLRIHIDGIPLELASRLLPWRTRWSFGLQSHLHLHARFQERYASRSAEVKVVPRTMPKTGVLGLVDSLRTTVEALEWPAVKTQWGAYYGDTNYSDEAFSEKQTCVTEWTRRVAAEGVFDLGSNEGVFSEAAVAGGARYVVAMDADPVAVQRCYVKHHSQDKSAVTPLLMDLSNPSPAQGWDQRERASLEDRGPVELVLALALIHHLALSNNVPLPRLADFFARLGRHLIIEFVPKEDSQVQRLLAGREDIFGAYDLGHFERAFAAKFEVLVRQPLGNSKRVLFLMKRRAPCA